MIPITRIFVLIIVLVGIAVAGTIGFAVLEHMSLLDALFTTVVLISTVGLGTAPATAGGKLLAIFIIVSGVGMLIYVLGSLFEFLVEGYFGELLGERSMKKKISELSNHYIICGFGRVGEQVAREFVRSRESFVVVDSNPDSIERCGELGYLFVEGDAADDEVLSRAGIDRAQGLVACVDSDADNVFVTLTARVLAPGLRIVSRANFEESYGKLQKAGANKVISPYAIGGREMATLMLKPMVSDYFDGVTGGGELELRVEQFRLEARAAAVGKTIKELEVRQRTGAMILAVRRAGARFDMNPDPDTRLEADSELIGVGTPVDIQALERLLVHE